MDQTFAMRLFMHVVEDGSFSKAAPRMGITQSSASKYISNLEAELGVLLLQRTTRKHSLTEAGQLYYERVCQIITDIDDAQIAIQQLGSSASGLLRCTAPASFGRLHIAPLLNEFQQLYPNVKIGLSLTDTIDDVIGEGYDLAIRLGHLNDTALIAKKLANCRSPICASPSYLEKEGIPLTPIDLEKHNCLVFRSTPGRNLWAFKRGSNDYSVAVSGSLYADNGDALLSAALSGLGIVMLPGFMMEEEIQKGTLVSILDKFEQYPNETPIQAVFGSKQMPPKVRVFLDFLLDKYKNKEW